MSKDKKRVLERLKAKIKSENIIFIKKNLAISKQVTTLLKERGWTQKELANKLGKTESEISRMLSGFHNITLKSLAKLEAVLGSEIIFTPLEVSEKYKNMELVNLRLYVPVNYQYENKSLDYVEDCNVEYQKSWSKNAV